MAENTENPSVTLFREYLRIKTVQPNPDYPACNAFLTKVAQDLGLPYKIVEMVPGKPIFIMTWEGAQPDLPAISLNSHTDVVPVFAEKWKYDPFEAVKEENGDIYARGTQDMKSIGIQHIEAVRRLKQAGKKLKRTIHLCFNPDEEIGSLEGMKLFAESEEFKQLNIGFALDEGIASPGEDMELYYGERNIFWIKFHIPGRPGHALRLPENTAAEKANHLTSKIYEFRESQIAALKNNPNKTLGEVTSVNLTMLSGGVQMNIIPDEITLCFDFRIPPSTNLEEFERMIRGWCEEAGSGIELEFAQKCTDQTLTSVDPEDPWFKAFTSATNKHNLKIQPLVFCGVTDNRFVRAAGIPAFGFSPIYNTPQLLHDNNEFINEKIFLHGIDIFYDIIESVASV